MTVLDVVIPVDPYTRDNLYIVTRPNSIVAPNRPRTHRILTHYASYGATQRKLYIVLLRYIEQVKTYGKRNKQQPSCQ